MMAVRDQGRSKEAHKMTTDEPIANYCAKLYATHLQTELTQQNKIEM